LLYRQGEPGVRRQRVSESWLVLAARVPERENKQRAVLGLVVDEVPHAAQEQPPHSGGSSAFILGAKATRPSEQGYRFTEVGADGARGGGAVDEPPLACPANLGGCTSCDLDPQPHIQLCLGRD